MYRPHLVDDVQEALEQVLLDYGVTYVEGEEAIIRLLVMVLFEMNGCNHEHAATRLSLLSTDLLSRMSANASTQYAMPKLRLH